KKGVYDAFEAVKKLEAYQVESEKIVKMISEVAEKTNIISINTAIEAARAGTNGKGFTVIAGEIRKLVLMSTGYTNDITTIIRNMNSSVFTVVKAIAGVEESLKKILQGVTDTTPIISEISKTMADVMDKDTVLLRKGTELADNVDIVEENARKQLSIAEIYTTTFDSLKQYLNILATTIDTLRDQNEKASTAVDSLKVIQNENTLLNKSIRQIMEQEV
ncbi:MAG: hypothetical protein EHM28_13895, partial [Spirochaetaceae bacterium]